MSTIEGFDTITEQGTRRFGGVTGPLGPLTLNNAYGVLLVIASIDLRVQLLFCFSNREVITRFSANSGSTWGEWLKLT